MLSVLFLQSKVSVLVLEVKTKHIWLVHLLLLNGDCLIDLVLLYPLLEICFLNVPVVYEVEVISISFELVLEHAYELLVVWLFFKLELPSVVHIVLKHFRVPFAEVFNARYGFFDLDLFILLLLGLCRQSLPR